jgi:hypothetical protein
VFRSIFLGGSTIQANDHQGAAMTTIAQIAGGYSIGQIAIAVVIVAAVVALVVIALRQFGIAIPPWVVQVFWVIVVAFIVICAIKLVLSM